MWPPHGWLSGQSLISFGQSDFVPGFAIYQTEAAQTCILTTANKELAVPREGSGPSIPGRDTLPGS